MWQSIDFHDLPTSVNREERFWLLVEKTESCWVWHGSIGKVTGYGSIGDESVHRFAYELLVGPIPVGLQIDHLCRNRWCVNPEHLEPVTPRENYLRGMSPPAQNSRKTHCLHGHPFDAANTFITPEGWRQCRTCIALGQQRINREKGPRSRRPRPVGARWARDWDACWVCGTAEYRHHSHGRCSRCNDRHRTAIGEH